MLLWVRVTVMRWRMEPGLLLGVLSGCSSIVEPIIAAHEQGSGGSGAGVTTTSDASTASTGALATNTSGDTEALDESGPATDTEATGEPTVCPLDTAWAWRSSGPLLAPRTVDGREITSLKDPSVVRAEDRWHVFATVAFADDTPLGIGYFGFEDWTDASDTEPVLLDRVEGLSGYHAAPQVFHFAPQETWYLVYQSPQPQYSTTRTLGDPLSWSAPTNFFPADTSLDGWVDFWVVCDSEDCFLFFTDHAGALYRSRTPVDDFPAGMSEPELALQEAEAFELFEGVAVYAVADDDRFLALVQARGGSDAQYYKAYVATSLAGTWSPLRATWNDPFASNTNVTFDGDAWTRDVGQGELLRLGNDATMTVDPCRMQLLHQGRRAEDDSFALGLLTREGS